MNFHLSKWLRIGRILFAGLAIAALSAQLRQSIEAGRSTVDFFSYFTIQSNMMAVIVLLWVAMKSGDRNKQLLRDIVRGAPVLYLGVTGIVFAVLLSGLPLVTVPFANTVLHKIMPVVLIVDWLLDPPHPGLSFRKALVWMVYPIAWLVYAMARGTITGWYPYPFLNPAKMGGYIHVLEVMLVILAGGVLLIGVIVRIGHFSRRYFHPGES